MKKLEYYLELFQMFIKKKSLSDHVCFLFFFFTDTVRLQYKYNGYSIKTVW